jgi:hypothetical protein
MFMNLNIKIFLLCPGRTKPINEFIIQLKVILLKPLEKNNIKKK